MASRTLSSTAILSAGPVPDLMDIKQESRPAAIGLTAGIAVMQGRQERFRDPPAAPAMAHKRDNLEE